MPRVFIGFQSLYRSGAILAGGSDWNVSSMNPLDAMQVAVTRMGLENEGGEAVVYSTKRWLCRMWSLCIRLTARFANHQEKENGFNRSRQSRRYNSAR